MRLISFPISSVVIPVCDSASRVGYLEVVPLRMPLRVQVPSQIELVIRVGYFHHFAEISGFETRLESQVRVVVFRPGRFGDEEDVIAVGSRFSGEIRGER